jgi:hypothetical protein
MDYRLTAAERSVLSLLYNKQHGMRPVHIFRRMEKPPLLTTKVEVLRTLKNRGFLELYNLGGMDVPCCRITTSGNTAFEAMQNYQRLPWRVLGWMVRGRPW